MQFWSDFLNQYGYAPNSLPAGFYDTSLKTDSSYEAGGVGAEKLFAHSTFTVSSGDAITVISGTDPTYRIWVGDPDPSLAEFSVDKTGTLKVNSISLNNGNVIINNNQNGIVLKNTIPISWLNHTNNLSPLTFAGQIYVDASDVLHINTAFTGVRVQIDATLSMGGNNIDSVGTISAGTISFATGHIDFSSGRLHLDPGGGNQIRMDQDIDMDGHNINAGNTIFLSGNSFQMTGGSGFKINGNSKSAIVPTTDGYKALYSAEAPEVWFFDFAKDKEHIDPLFLNVTEGDMKTLRTEEDEILVFRRRKGHAHKRFAPKTFAEFKKNEQFLAMADL